ncbi:cytoskeleton assembly control protein, putative [Candida dubliniensis CD36]|uniref:Actin cytoskeleton-regulatory complex protein SLA1 n=1 Tax=Candida dubliniensis (strain CD36 / ATCC MYA-646 / CBS 7987 / NCPF 3949 / NRRL Y-17841) TaxID=573826 RepID=B9WAL0_CANDC|nr:cytoskeleton assembly control protein, putative [Candida dubliniensis CD36]CAX43430.1 cytoskeleton assembly control protein, putative [Candida dubliniensis CD36]
MSSIYIGVYKALYDYTAQAEEELSIKENDLLYLLEKSDIDDWWKVKKRVVATGDEIVDEPSGLVPSTYIEEAPVIKTATALYDYDKQTEEELSFNENDKFNVFDLNDPDWILVGDLAKEKFGFVPANYIQLDSSEAAATTEPAQFQQQQQQQQQPQQTFQPPPQQQQTQIPINNFPPPPSHKDRTPDFPAPPVHKDRSPEHPPPTPEKDYPRMLEQEPRSSATRYHQEPERREGEGEEEEAPPPMPSRPTASSIVAPAPVVGRSNTYEQEESIEQNEHSYDGEFFTWYIDEVDGRKKRAIKLSIGQGLVIIKPNTTNPKKLRMRSSSSLDNQWRIKDLITFNNEKKHVFLEFKNPAASLELHAGSKDVAEAIMAILGDLKGAEAAHGLREVAKASKASANESNRKIGRLLYDFEAQGDDELDCKEGDEVYIIDQKKSKDWWMVENRETRRQGVVPSTYIEIVSTSNLDKLTDGPLRTKSTKSKGRVVEAKDKRSSHHRSREERDRIREKDRAQRDKASSSQAEQDKSMPNFHRVRTWIDSSGTFKVEAEFLGCVEGKIHLHKTNGVKIAVSADKLSVEDLEYVERITGTSLEQYKEQVMKQQAKRARSKSKSGATATTSGSNDTKYASSATAAINDIAPPKPTRPQTTTQVSNNGAPLYDWFDFFLECGVDIGNCQRYTLNFEREQMDENILEDISPSLLRTLGLREGDIIRVMKYLDAKFDRKKTPEAPQQSGGLFIDKNGNLKNNSSSTEISKVSADALPSPVKTQVTSSTPVTESSQNNNKIEDDAWAMKPAARSSEDLLKPSPQPQTPQYTGALSDLVNIKPVGTSNENKIKTEQSPAAPALQPTKTSNTTATTSSIPPQGSSVTPQRTGTLVPVQKTGGLVPVQRTGGGLVAVQTGGYLPSQPTGFVPITAQPTGFIPIQATGILQPQLTFGIVPLQTGTTTFNANNKTAPPRPETAPPPITTFGQQPTFQPAFVPLQTGVITMPQTTFGGQQQQLPNQITGGAPPQTSFNQPALVPSQRTGGQITGGFVPQSNFGKQITGGFMDSNTLSLGQQITGNAPPPPTTSFGQQITGGLPTTSFGQQITGGFPQTSFGQQITGGAPQTSFGQHITGGAMPNTSFGQSFSQQATSNPFPQMANQFTQPQQPQPVMNQFQPQPQVPQQQPYFNQFQSQPNLNQMTNMFQNTSISSPATFNQQIPTTTFGQQPQFEGFGSQPLQSQPTGMGFGNAPLQSQPTGKRANLQAATPDNPFGF